MGNDVRVTTTVARVLKVFLEDQEVRWYGLELTKATELPSGTLYPVLARLERAGWLVSQKEAVNPKEAGRPARRYYTLNPVHVARARQELATLAERVRLVSPQPSLTGGLLHQVRGGAA